ncbi:MAG: hypothetical protein ABSF46_13930 [Terriglobia bacterium]|jgi:hypothetical protein
MINAVKPWMSEADIDKGSQWHSELHSHLQDTAAGIVCLTPDNREAPWLLFEAGSLANAVGRGLVCTYLHRLKTIDLKEPLSQFQATVAEKEDTRRLVQTINRALSVGRVPDGQLNSAFDMCWPKLETALMDASKLDQGTEPVKREERDILEDMYVLVREQSRPNYPQIADLIAREMSKQNMAQLEALKKREEWAQLSTNLTTGVIKAATVVLRLLTEELRQLCKDGAARPPFPCADLDLLRRRMLQQVFRNLRTVFEADTRGIDTTTWPHNFFKVALFEPVGESPLMLRRTGYDYPEGLEPSPQTETIDIDHFQQAALALAFHNKDIVVIQDIKSEVQKPPETSRWMDLRPRQSDEYESMVCAAVITGRKLDPRRRCLGVLVIDTNRASYFAEDRDFKAFLGTLLNPFRTMLTLILELNLYFGCRAGTTPEPSG